MYASYNYERRLSKYGGRFDLWITHVDKVATFIEKYNLIPIPKEHLLMEAGHQFNEEVEKLVERRKLFPWPFPFPGGLKVPHLHFKGEIYYLQREQWKEFSSLVISDFKEKLGQAGVVSYDQLMGMTESIGSFG